MWVSLAGNWNWIFVLIFLLFPVKEAKCCAHSSQGNFWAPASPYWQPYDIHLFFLIFLPLFFIVICLVTSCTHIVGGTFKNVLQLCKPFLDLHAVQPSSLINGSGCGSGISIFELYERVEQSVISVSKGTCLNRCIFWLWKRQENFTGLWFILI